MPTIQGSGPRRRIVRWLNENPPPYGWEGSELMWARLEMPLHLLYDPEDRWPGPLGYVQALLDRDHLLWTFAQAEEELRELPRFASAPHRGNPNWIGPGTGK